MPPPKFVYKRREPEKTDLHRLVRTWFPSIPHMLRERFGPRAKLAKFQLDAVERYLDCGQLANGFVRVRCTSCGDDRLFSSAAPARFSLQVFARGGLAPARCAGSAHRATAKG